MYAMAKVTSKGQITVPQIVREALGLRQGDAVHFTVQGEHAVIERSRRVDELAGVVPTPPEIRGMSWDEIMAEANRMRAKEYRR